MKSLTLLSLPLCWALAVLPPWAEAELLYDRDGIQLEGEVRVSTRNAATCNVLEEKYPPEEYERLKANQGQPLHVWRLDLSIHNNSGKAVEFLRADFEIDSPHPPCTNWSGEGPGGGPLGDRIDAEGNPRPLEWAVPFKVVSKPYGMAPREVDRETLFLLVFHSQEPVLKRWEINYTFARTRSQAPSAQQAREDPPRAARRPRIQLPPDILADKYLRQAEQLVGEKDYEGARKAMEALVALQQEHGLEPSPEDHFRYARIWSAAGAPEQAMEAAVRYLQLGGREAEHYEEALDLINRAEAAQARAEAGSGGPGGSAGIRVGETVVFDGMEFVGIPPGEFLMGYIYYEAAIPLTRVNITKGFYLGKYEVTQDEWQAVMGNNPSGFPGCGRCPVEQVSWEEAQAFIGKLNDRSGGGRYRLPTEAEWEYAARAGTTTDTYAGDITKTGFTDPVLNGIARYMMNSGDRTHPVGQKAPNGFGLYDMLGNVEQWVGDWYGDYPGGAVTDPAGPASGSMRVNRGCYWEYPAMDCLLADRSRSPPGFQSSGRGFRLLREE